MNNIVDRLKRVMSYSEVSVIKALTSEIGNDKELSVNSSKLCEKVECTRSIMVNALKLLEVAGVLETRSMGMKGTHIRVLDQDTLQAIANF